MTDLKYRMYGLVPYNLSPIQQGIQFGHGVVEYIMRHYSSPETQNWANRDKVFIILNGGTTNNREVDREPLGSLNKQVQILKDNGIKYSVFHEPDLGDQLTSINFLVDERVWDYEKYPAQFMGGSPNVGNNNMVPDIYYMPESDEDYTERLGGKQNVFLREFLRKFKLA